MRGLASRLLCLCVLLGASAERGNAHVGAPDVYVKAAAGPYQLLVSVHPPAATPGVAAIDIRTEDTGVSAVTVSISGGSPQPLQRFSTEQIFTGSVWVASSGAWRVTIHVSGNKGDSETSVPIPAAPVAAARLLSLRELLFGLLGICLLIALVLWVRQRWSVAVAVVLAVCAVLGVLNFLFVKPPASSMQLTLMPSGKLHIVLPGKMDDLVEDHNHLMHLFAVRQPQMDVLLHLHPVQVGPGTFEADLPSMAPGAFALYADVVHRDGRLETFAASAGLPQRTGGVLEGDDSVGVIPGLSRSQPVTGPGTTTVRLMDGYTMTLDLRAPLRAKSGQLLRFALLDPEGNPASDMRLYMGMSAHAAVLKTDGTVFAHIHPAGTIPMAAYGSNMAGMAMPSAATSQVSFPFGFPSSGAYRVFVEMKHGTIVETAAFDLLVAP